MPATQGSLERTGSRRVIDRSGLQRLIDVLGERGFGVIGPTRRDGAIVYGEVDSVQDLPAGFTDEQEGATYRLVRRSDDRLFGYAVGPSSPKRYLYPPRSLVTAAERDAEGTWVMVGAGPVPPPGGIAGRVADREPDHRSIALLGVRACELAAIAVQDRVFLDGAFPDPVYASLRDDLFVVAVNCSDPSDTCFCVSMGTGPAATSGFDLALTEITVEGRDELLVEVGSPAGAEVLAALDDRPAHPVDEHAARQVVEGAAARMGRELDTTGIAELLYESLEHPRWAEVAERCLACANCTFVCPTCFCSTIEDVTDLPGDRAERWRRWDSCFSLEFSHMHGGDIRSTTRARYRQWLTHKLAGWIQQFGTSGCVGCGRCITWCPVGIDLTEEVRAIRGDQRRQVSGT